jgi:dTDP-4-dehydrorhamnose 3,5-epimerase
MKTIETSIPGVLIIEPKYFSDPRGFFIETFEVNRYAAVGIARPFVQDNLSRSSRGVLRGLHLQNPNPQGKLVNVLRGSILDAVIDLRVGSPSFKQHLLIELSEANRLQLWVPRGFGHGFLVLSEMADVMYKVDAPYCPGNEIVVRWNDPALAIDWGIDTPIMSEKDSAAPVLGDIKSLPVYEP